MQLRMSPDPLPGIINTFIGKADTSIHTLSYIIYKYFDFEYIHICRNIDLYNSAIRQSTFLTGVSVSKGPRSKEMSEPAVRRFSFSICNCVASVFFEC